MGKTSVKLIGTILAVLLIGLLILTFSLDGIVKSSIQENGASLLKTEVDVENVSISIFDGKGSIEGLIIQNPEGFTDQPAIQFQNISIEVDLSTLLSDTVIVRNVIVEQPEIYVEQTTDGNNLKTLQNHLNASSSEGSYEGHLVVDHLLINRGSVKLSSKIGEERTAQAEIDRFELTGVGREGNNSVDQTVRQILEPVLERALREALKEGVLDAVENKLRDLLDGG